MTKKEKLIQALVALVDGDTERNHEAADNLIIEYINDKEIKKAYEDIDKWFA